MSDCTTVWEDYFLGGNVRTVDGSYPANILIENLYKEYKDCTDWAPGEGILHPGGTPGRSHMMTDESCQT